jgi:hypothetical protein
MKKTPSKTRSATHRPRPDGRRPPASGPAQASGQDSRRAQLRPLWAIRWLLGLAMSGLPRDLLCSGKGRGLTDAIVLATVADIKAKAAADAVERARPADKPQAEIKALRAEEQAAERHASIADRLALRR